MKAKRCYFSEYWAHFDLPSPHLNLESYNGDAAFRSTVKPSRVRDRLTIVYEKYNCQLILYEPEICICQFRLAAEDFYLYKKHKLNL